MVIGSICEYGTLAVGTNRDQETWGEVHPSSHALYNRTPKDISLLVLEKERKMERSDCGYCFQSA